MFFTVLGDLGDAPAQCFFDFFMTAPSRTPTFESISERDLPKTFPKSMIPRDAVPQKSKKRRAIAVPAISGCGHLGQSGRLWGELWEGLEELWESSGGLYI